MSKDSCEHVEKLRNPAAGVPIHKDECTQCFDNDAAADGLNVCLTCFNGGCTGSDHHYVQHAAVTGHPVVLNIKKTEIPPEPESGEPQKITKVAIGVEGGLNEKTAPKFKYTTEVRCLPCKSVIKTNAKLESLVDSILKSDAASKPDVSVWDIPPEPCEHTMTLNNDGAPSLKTKSLSHCESCELNQDLWLCMTCGALGCSRAESGGKGHAVEHNKKTKHPVVLKVGTITPQGTADLYCYACNNSRTDPYLAQHLDPFGIKVEEQVKTAQTTEEKELALNLNRNWDSVIESGVEAELVYGAGNTGLENLGNSCYMSSVLQCTFSLPTFQRRYYGEGRQHLLECRNGRPADCFQCQMAKLACGLQSGKYSPAPTTEMLELWNRDAKKAKVEKKEKEEKVTEVASKKPLQPGVPPRMFKKLICRDHPEFKAGKQQDADEFLVYLLTQIQQKERATGADPTTAFNFQLEERQECQKCHSVRYKTLNDNKLRLPVIAQVDQTETEKRKAVYLEKSKEEQQKGKKPRPFDDIAYLPTSLDKCFGKWSSGGESEINCPTCKEKTQRTSSFRFTSYPDVLVLTMSRFSFEGWVMSKLDLDIAVEDQIDLTPLKAKGLQSGEKELPGDSASKPAAAAKVAKPEFVANVESMGFSKNRAIRAVLAVDNAGVDPAVNWLMEHMDDVGLDDPLPAETGAATRQDDDVPADAVAMLQSMGFDAARCKFALIQCKNDSQRAIDWLFSHEGEPLPTDKPKSKEETKTASTDTKPARYRLCAFITHLGKSPTTGHYVAHLMKEGKWILFNDSKVSIASKPPKHAAYMYFFRRVPN